MGAYRPNIYWHGRQNFPTPDRSSLPVNDLIAHYTRNLLPHTPWHTEFLFLLFARIGVPAVVKVLIDKCGADMSQKNIDDMRKQNDSSNAGSLVLSAIEVFTTQLTEAALRTGLAMVLTQSLPSFSDCGEYRRRADHLCELLGLEAADLAILECCICAQLEGLFHNYCKEYYDSDWVALVAVAVNLQKQEVQKRLSKGGTLVSRGLIDMRKVSAPVFEYLMGISSEFLSSDDFSLGTSSAFPLDSFPVSEKERHLLVETLRNPAPCHLFFYGRPGTGKTELAKALAAESGKQAFLVKYRNDGDEKDRRGAIVATFGIAPAGAVVIIDEADVLLNTATLVARKMVDKGWVNNFMDECRHKVIWIANNTHEIEASVLRRFSYSLEFKKFTAVQRLSAWKVQLTGHPLCKSIPPEMIGRLSREYEVDAGGIASALKAAESVLSGRNREAAEIEKTLGSFLEHHEKLSGVRRKKNKLNRLSPNYDVNALHTDFPAVDLIAGLKERESADHPFAANIMFWGLPGTGKTEFAKYIAQELGKELLVKRMSDLQSMFVGQTEKQIAAAFDEADREGAVLFLDEADSLILDRKTASRSWESSQTNEVLTQMENFKGICICCTNLLDGLDEAALRRFTWKIKFLPLTVEGAETLFRKYFQPAGRLSKKVKTDLRTIRDLTPGDFKTVWQRQQYSGIKPSALDNVKALKQEASYKRTRSGNPIGFTV